MQLQVLGRVNLLSQEDRMEVGREVGFRIRHPLEVIIFLQLLRLPLEVLLPLAALVQLGLEEMGLKIVPLQLTALARPDRPHLAKL